MSFPDGHFYSPIPDVADVERRAATLWDETRLTVPGVDLNDASHRHVLEALFPRFLRDYDYPEQGTDDDQLTQFYSGNSQFGWLDSRALFVLLRAWRPRRIIEVGSGYSSLLMGDVNRRFLDGAAEIVCIEPYPRPFFAQPSALGIAAVVRAPVQDVPLATFAALERGDVLFIDSSHVAKVGSDVNRLLLEIVPSLRAGVRVHVHDVFLPHDYPQEWVAQLGTFWNEQYLLQALLARSGHAYRTVFGCYYAHLRFPDLVARALGRPPGHGFGGASFWFEIAG